jgi:ABC-type transport system substrate-binding protein
MSELNYWTGVLKSRMARRRALARAASLGGGAMATLMLACGGDNEDDELKPQQSSLVYQPQESTNQAKRGGVFKGLDTSDPPSMDPLTSSAFQTTSVIAYRAYPRFMKWEAAKYPDFASGTSEPELAEGWELSGDKLQLTLKLRGGMKWDGRPPTNNRLIDAQDILFSWNRFSELNPLATAFSSVESLTAPDAHTISVNLKTPDASIIQLFTSATLFYVLPHEAEGGFDARGEVRGHGPWMLTEVSPSARRVWTRNPDYYLNERPLIESWEMPIISEYATRLAQLMAGNIYSIDTGGLGAAGVRQEDIIATKRDLPDMRVVQSDAFQATPSFISFGYEGDSPFKDERMRQAAALLIDREAMIDVVANRNQFRAEGLEIPVRYHTLIGAGWEGYWLDPQDEGAFGPTAKYLTYNPEDAAKLMDAAGHGDGVDTAMFYSLGAQYGEEYTRVAEILPGMFAQGGVRVKPEGKDYQTDWLPNIYFGYLTNEVARGTKKGFNGIMYGLERAYPTVATQLAATMHKDGERFHGLTPDGNDAHLGDPMLNGMVDRVKVEFDMEAQQRMVQEIIRYTAEKAYNVPATFARLNFDVNWPVIGNYGAYRTYNSGNVVSESLIHWWLDESQPPLQRP